jgi:hypothetical protein
LSAKRYRTRTEDQRLGAQALGGFFRRNRRRSKPLVTLSAADLTYPKPKRDYNALTANFDQAFDGKWSLSGSYTGASLKGNYEGGVRSDNGQTAINTTADFDSPGFLNGADGYLPNHRLTPSRPMAATRSTTG